MQRNKKQNPFFNISKEPPRFSVKEWHQQNVRKNKTCLNQQIIADNILAECERIRDELMEMTLQNQREVEHKTEARISDIEFNKNELKMQIKEVEIMIDDLLMLANRIKDFRDFLKNPALEISKSCSILREKRVGIDLCNDEVQSELLVETKLIEKCVSLFADTLQQITEQIRKLRSNLYFLNSDLDGKEQVLELDSSNLKMKEYFLEFQKISRGISAPDPRNITEEDWDRFTRENIKRSAVEIDGARNIKSEANVLMKKIYNDLVRQRETINKAFRNRIDETKEAKEKMEMRHSEVVKKANEMAKNAVELKKSLNIENHYMSLSHRRMENRSRRTGIELCQDQIDPNLIRESSKLRENCNILEKLLSEANASIRYLLRHQVDLETEINVKVNSLKIDDVDCMTIRQGLNYQPY